MREEKDDGEETREEKSLQFIRHLEREAAGGERSPRSDFFFMRQYYVYIMSNRTHVLYIGVTNNLESRAGQHREGATAGFTQRYHLNRLVYFEAYERVDEAIAREKQLKGWKRERKIALIEALNPRWSDLSRE